MALAGTVTQHPEHLFELTTALPDDQRRTFFETVAQQVAYKDPAPIADAISANLESPLAAEFAGTLVGVWAKNGLRAPSRWLAELPEGAVRDAGAIALVEELAPHDAAAAVAWAKSVGDEEARAALLEKLAP